MCDFKYFPTDQCCLHGQYHDKEKTRNDIGAEFCMYECREAFMLEKAEHTHKDRALSRLGKRNQMLTDFIIFFKRSNDGFQMFVIA
jgi:hypothetical protein